MHYAPTAEQHEFARTIRAFLERRAPESKRPGVAAGTDRFDPALWREMAGQLELLGIAVPESLGGSGFGDVERGLVVEELGRALVPAPFFASTVLALPLIVSDGSGAAATYVPDILGGRSIACAALAETGRSAETTPTVQASADGRLSGTKTLVMDGDLADLFVVSGLDAAGHVALFVVRADAPGVRVEPQAMLDPTRGGARVVFDDAVADPIATSQNAERLIADVLVRARIALAFEQLGGAQRCLELAVEHAKDREQFGRPIGSFQAVKHLCAEVMCAVEAARGAAWYAAWAVDASSDELPSVAHTAKYLCSQAYLEAARTCVHVLGGIGYTWEHPAQLFFKRATSDAQFLGSASDELNRLAACILSPTAALGHPR